jgi:hypothetical protein
LPKSEGKTHDIFCQKAEKTRATSFVSDAHIAYVPYKTGWQADVHQESGDHVTACLPSRLSRVRVPSPAPLTHQVSLQAVDKPFEDKQAALQQARRRCCFWQERVCIASPKIFPDGFATYTVFSLHRFATSAGTPPGAKNAKHLVPEWEQPHERVLIRRGRFQVRQTVVGCLRRMSPTTLT